MAPLDRVLRVLQWREEGRRENLKMFAILSGLILDLVHCLLVEQNLVSQVFLEIRLSMFLGRKAP